jgi:thymidine kinase
MPCDGATVFGDQIDKLSVPKVTCAKSYNFVLRLINHSPIVNDPNVDFGCTEDTRA